MTIRICILGCGAIGGVFGAFLAQLEDVEVFGYDVWSEHIRAINSSGIQIVGEEILRAHFRVTEDVSTIPRCDFGIVATKGLHTRPAIIQAAQIFDSSSAVFSLQNGLGNEEILAQSTKNVLRGSTFFAAHIVGPGVISLDSKGDTWMGPFEPSGTPYAYVETLSKLLGRAGLQPEPLRDARGAQWSKLIFNSAINPVGALTLLCHQTAERFKPTATLFEGLIREGEAVAKSLHIRLHTNPRDLVRRAAEAPGSHRASMLEDIIARRLTEVDLLNGAIAALGEEKGVPTPLNQAMCQLIKGLERSWNGS